MISAAWANWMVDLVKHVTSRGCLGFRFQERPFQRRQVSFWLLGYGWVLGFEPIIFTYSLVRLFYRLDVNYPLWDLAGRYGGCNIRERKGFNIEWVFGLWIDGWGAYSSTRNGMEWTGV